MNPEINLHENLSLLVDHEHPLSSANTHAVAASITCGGNLAENGYLDTIEQGIDGKPRRTVVWLLKSSQIEFKAFAGETISQSEFLKRWNDRQWIIDNPDHPIAFMKCLMENVGSLRNEIKNASPTIKVTRGGRAAFIPSNASESERQRLISKL
jgi:hypothetical protein